MCSLVPPVQRQRRVQQQLANRNQRQQRLRDKDMQDAARAAEEERTEALVEEERELTEREKEIARLRAAEKFMMKNTGDAICQTCSYKYQMAEGVQDRAYPIQRNTPFEIIPDS